MRRGDAPEARACLEQAVAAGAADASTLLGLAQACRALKDDAGTRAAIDRVLAMEPRNPIALIMKADCLAETGDDRAASAFYTAAVRSAPPPAQRSPQMVQELQRAQAMCQQYAERYKRYLRERLAQAGFSDGRSSSRFSQSLGILFGERKIYVQEPRYYYFPGLPQVQFFERGPFRWLDALESATADIRTELLEILELGDAFTPYVQGDPNRPRKRQDGMLNNPDWSAYYLVKDGDAVAENAARCPKTMRALQDLPLARIPNRTPSILFSLLRPGAKIPPHNGLVNVRLICHLPLLVPGHCGFRVGNETREWQEGRAWVFDDTIEHEAWNGSDRPRVILLFDIWRPELSEEERALVVAMFAAVDSYSGTRPEWET